MPTPDFEDWMERQDVPLEETETRERYQTSLVELFHPTLPLGAETLSPAQAEVAGGVWERKYSILEPAGIKPIEYEREYKYVTIQQTRYAISGLPGLFAAPRAYEIAEERMRAAGEREKADIARARREEIEKYPEKYRAKYV